MDELGDYLDINIQSLNLSKYFLNLHEDMFIDEIYFLKEAYRFFILNYVIKDGKYFFNEQYAKKLQEEAFEIYLPSVDRDFDAEHLIHELKIN